MVKEKSKVYFISSCFSFLFLCSYHKFMRHSENGEASSNNDFCLNKLKPAVITVVACVMSTEASPVEATVINYLNLSGSHMLNVK
jgi:hypothetical protein